MSYGSVAKATDYVITELALCDLEFNEFLLLSSLYNAKFSLVPDINFFIFVLVNISE